MPIISTFFGIVIRMFYSDHEPLTSTLSIRVNRGSLILMAA